MRFAAAAAALVALCAAGCGGHERVQPPPPHERPELVIQDDSQLLYASPKGIRDAVTTMRALGVDRVRITAGWGILTPDPQGRPKPDFDDTDSAAYPQDNWKALDRALTEITRQGLRPMVDIAFWAPRWATARDVGGPDRYRWKPDPVLFGHFAEALARRYNGNFTSPVTDQKLPAVRLWTTWNEPNHSAFLLPQWERQGKRWVPVAAHHYRSMHEQAYAAVKRVNARNRVLVGGLTSFGADRPGTYRTIPPLRFARELACVDAKLQPQATPECSGFEPIRADGFAQHPYVKKLPPCRSLPNPDSVGVGDLHRMSSLLGRLYEHGRTQTKLGLFVTEFGYETNPPDPKRGVSLATQARWLSEAAAIGLREPGLRMYAQFLLRDLGEDRLFQTGLILPDGQPKPSFLSFRMPFWIFGREAIGRVYPARGVVRVRIERFEPDHTWKPVVRLRTDRNGIVRQRLPADGTYRLRWGRELSLAVATSPPRRACA